MSGNNATSGLLESKWNSFHRMFILVKFALWNHSHPYTLIPYLLKCFSVY